MIPKKMGPAAKLRALRFPNASRAKMNRLFETGASANVLKSSRRAIGGVASAVRRYTAFCGINGIRPFPAQEKYVLQRSSVFNETATFQQYVNSLRKACYVLRRPTDWSNPAVAPPTQCSHCSWRGRIEPATPISSEVSSFGGLRRPIRRNLMSPA